MIPPMFSPLFPCALCLLTGLSFAPSLLAQEEAEPPDPSPILLPEMVSSIILIHREGEDPLVQLDGRVVTLDELSAQMKKQAESSPEEGCVCLYVEPAVPWQKVKVVVALCEEAGMSQIMMSILPQKP